MTDAKVCGKCSESKQLSDFHKMKSNKDGLHHTCKDCRRIQDRAYYSSNSEKVKANVKLYSENNKEKLSAYRKAWAESRPDRTAAQAGKGTALNRGGSTSEIYDLELCVPFYEEARRLSKETGVLHHVDHIVPLAKGGLHCQTNLQVLTAVENIQKGDSVGQSH